jgi:hypothetical protein
MVNAEKVERRRGWLLLIAAAGFILWQAGELSTVKQGLAESGLAMMTPIGIVMWIGAGAALLVPPRGQRLRAMLEDERIRLNRLVALSWGYSAMILAAFAGISLGTREWIGAEDLARLVLIVGVAAPLIPLILLDRRAGYGD